MTSESPVVPGMCITYRSTTTLRNGPPTRLTPGGMCVRLTV